MSIQFLLGCAHFSSASRWQSKACSGTVMDFPNSLRESIWTWILLPHLTSGFSSKISLFHCPRYIFFNDLWMRQVQSNTANADADTSLMLARSQGSRYNVQWIYPRLYLSESCTPKIKPGISSCVCTPRIRFIHRQCKSPELFHSTVKEAPNAAREKTSIYISVMSVSSNHVFSPGCISVL